MADDPNSAESIDETVTTTDGDGEGLRADYPHERPLGVEDPSIRADGTIAPDDHVTRSWRRDEQDMPEDPTPEDPAP